MNFIADIITRIVDILVLPFGMGKSHHTLQLIWLSLISGVGMAFVFKATSDQAAIRRVRNKFKAYILETRIYQDHLGIVFASLGRALWTNVVYLKLMLKPLIYLIVPVALLFMQMDERYSRKPLTPGSSTLLAVELNENADPFDLAASVSADSGVTVEAGPMRIEEAHQLDWRLGVWSEGTHEVSLFVDDTEYTLPIVAGPSYRMIGHTRSASSWIEPFLHPALPPIPAGSVIRSVSVHYAPLHHWLFFWHTHWIVVFLVWTLIGALIVKFVFGLEV